LAFDIVAVDVPIGLLDAYEVGGRACDRAARKLLGKRASSVFPAPIRSVLAATSWEVACVRSRASAPRGKAISKQTFAILDKIREVDELLQTRPEVRGVVREVHPEVCFRELAGEPMPHRKSSAVGREERRRALSRIFPQLDVIEKAGRNLRLPTEDILDAAVACWSALRLADGEGRSVPDPIPLDATGLPMAIWV
jgi:predicted RNase H-like nuclease